MQSEDHRSRKVDFNFSTSTSSLSSFPRTTSPVVTSHEHDMIRARFNAVVSDSSRYPRHPDFTKSPSEAQN